jgi:hypothetical protein
VHTLGHAPPLQSDWRGGGPPEWQPRFSGKQIQQVRAVARQHTARHTEVQRARLALLLYRHSEMTSPKAARQLGAERVLDRWRRRSV